MNKLLVAAAMTVLGFGSVEAFTQAQLQSGYFVSDESTAVSPADKELAKQISEVINANMISNNFKLVSFKIADGVVILQGSVPSAEDKKKLEAAILEIEGVKNLDNKLIIQK